MYEANKRTPPDPFSGVFKPFGYDLWLGVAGLIFCHGVVVSLLAEKKEKTEDEDEEIEVVNRPRKQPKLADVVKSPRSLRKEQVHNLAKRYVSDFYESTMGFLGASVVGVHLWLSTCSYTCVPTHMSLLMSTQAENAQGVARRLLLIGYGFFILTVLAAYTVHYREPKTKLVLCLGGQGLRCA